MNDYFSILARLSMQDGYVLDYVYSRGFSAGRPFLFARGVNHDPDELILLRGPDSLQYPPYLRHVQADGSPEGFYELTLLLTLGC